MRKILSHFERQRQTIRLLAEEGGRGSNPASHGNRWKGRGPSAPSAPSTTARVPRPAQPKEFKYRSRKTEPLSKRAFPDERKVIADVGKQVKRLAGPEKAKQIIDYAKKVAKKQGLNALQDYLQARVAGIDLQPFRDAKGRKTKFYPQNRPGFVAGAVIKGRKTKSRS